MDGRVSAKQLQEMTDKQKDALKLYWYQKHKGEYDRHAPRETVSTNNGVCSFMLPRLSVGQMFELLKETRDKYRLTFGIKEIRLEKMVLASDCRYYDDLNDPKFWSWKKVSEGDDICDVLWDEVKAVLSKDQPA